MMNNNGNNGNNGEFEDDAFSDDAYLEADFDETALDDEAGFEEYNPDDVDYNDEDFANEDWGGEDSAQADQNLYRTEKKGLSFNAIVIIGAVIVGGGVMAMTIMNKTAQHAAGQKSVFQSILDIGGVMDGMLFGEKEEQATPEELAAQEQKSQDEGFLNNPDAANPPMPSPISPSEMADSNDPLTPMPGDVAPRGPEEVPPVGQDIVDTSPQITEAEPQSAEDILLKAMANRQQKTAGLEQAVITPPESSSADNSGNVAALPVASDPLAVQNAVTEAKEKQQEEARRAVEEAQRQDHAKTEEVSPASPQTIEQVAAVAASVQSVKALADASNAEIEQNRKAVATLESKIDTLLKRMEQIETEIGSVRDVKGGDYKQISDNVDSLKKEIAQLKQNPPAAPASTKAASKAADEFDEEDVATPEKVKPAPVKKAVKPKPAPRVTPDRTEASRVAAAPAAKTGRWELRAAQPGRAWVSRPGERDMQSVEVGGTLGGVGRVTAITYSNGRWAVIGTEGRIDQ